MGRRSKGGQGMKIAVDAMGGDYAPLEIVFGAVRSAKKY